jgi:SAM-dependent methyltransferase
VSKAAFDPTRRFSDRVENYAKYRPGYPRAVIDCLRDECGLTPSSVVADVGSGTGLLTELFLEHGNSVYAVEPNDEMRLAAEQLLGSYRAFRSVNGRAEATTLPDNSVDFIVAGQAFHWFEPEPARVEFGRILRLDGWVVLVWNTRLAVDGGFMTGFEALLDQFAPAYHDVNHAEQQDDVSSFYGGQFQLRTFANEQRFDFEGALGRLLSSSYAPPPGHPNYELLLAGLRHLFEAYQEAGQISFLYKTELFWGRPSLS